MVGPLDLSATVGAMGDTRAPRVLEIMEDVPKKLAGTGVACATTLVPYEHHELAVKWGYGVLNVGNPLACVVTIIHRTDLVCALRRFICLNTRLTRERWMSQVRP